MRRLLAGGLTLTAGLWLTSVRGGDLPAAAAADAGLPSVTLGRPTALEAPVVRTSTVAPVSDQNLRPAAFIMPALGRADAHKAQHLQCLTARFGATEPAMKAQDFLDLIADGKHGIEAGHGFLEDHADAIAP